VTITVSTYTAEGARHDIDSAAISDIVGTKGTLVWVDAVDASEADFICIREEFSLHHLAMEDATKHGQRPKLERYPTHAFVVAYSATFAEIDVFVGPGWVVTVRATGEDGLPWSLDSARRRFERSGPEEATSGFLLYILLDDLVDGYFDRTDAGEDRLEDIEERIFEKGLGDERATQQSLYELRRELVTFRRRVQPLREVISALLRQEVEWIDPLALLHFQDVYDHVLRAIDLLDSQRELLNNAVDAHLAIMSNRMNEVMKKMTSWGAILLVSTLIAGIYGMNFQHMPELHWRYGYPYALGLMALMTVVGYRYFKRRDWL
jgi:magnesium transporter